MPSWRRNLYILFTVQLLSTAGFSLVFPFLPLYVKEIGIATRGSVEFWAGMVFSSQALTMAIAAPIWGSLADRYGRKIMLARATLGGAVLLLLMGFAQNAEQLTVLRTIQGTVTGVIPAANALMAASAPRERSGTALGFLQMGRWGGIALGPVIGGLLGDAFGFRESFWITSVMLALAGVAVIFGVQEEFEPDEDAGQISFWGEYKNLFMAPGMMGLYALSFLNSLGRTAIFPFLSLFVVALTGNETGAAFITGIIIGSTAFSGAIAAVWLGRLGDRIGHGRTLVACAGAAMLLYIPQLFVTNPWQLAGLQAISGLAAGGLLPAIGALMNIWIPSGHQGAVFGLENSVTAGGRIFAPMIGASLAAWFGLRAIFGSAVVVYGLAFIIAIMLVRAPENRDRLTPQATPLPGDD